MIRSSMYSSDVLTEFGLVDDRDRTLARFRPLRFSTADTFNLRLDVLDRPDGKAYAFHRVK